MLDANERSTHTHRHEREVKLRRTIKRDRDTQQQPAEEGARCVWWQRAHGGRTQRLAAAAQQKWDFSIFFVLSAIVYRCYLLLVGFAHGMSHGPSWCATLSQAQELAKTKDEDGGGMS